MICFMDRRFCSSHNCVNKCGHKLSEEQKALARKLELPISWYSFCHIPGEKFIETSSTDQAYTADIE